MMNVCHTMRQWYSKVDGSYAEIWSSRVGFYDMEIGFRINLYRNVEDSKLLTDQERPDNQETGQKVKEKASNRKIIMEAIRNHPSITQKQLESIVGLPCSGVRYILRKLQ